MKKVLLLFIALSLSVTCLWAQDEDEVTDDTRVKDYSVSMNVHPDNTYDVVETITTHFDEPHHGIYRYIPYMYGMLGKTYLIDISDVDVDNEPFELDDENDNVLIKIGDEDEVISGDKKYTIHYTIRNCDDRIGSCDMFYHSIIGDYFQLPIDSLSFRIAFEKKLPAYAKDSLQVYSGPADYTGNKLNAKAWIKGNTICGYAVNIPNENAVTLRLRLPEGYYVGEDTVTPELAYFFLVLTILVAILLFYFEFTVKHPGITKQIEFYPPDDMCSAEVGTVIDGSVDKVDLASLIPWFAGKGYLRIDEKEEKGIFSKNKYLELTRLRELPSDAPEYQAKFFKALFSAGDTVRLDKMEKAAEDIQDASTALKDIYRGDRKLTSWHWSTFLLIPLLTLAACFLIAALPFHFMENSDSFAIILIWGTPAALGAVIVACLADGRLFTKGWVIRTLAVIRFICMLLVLMLYFLLFDELMVDGILICAVFFICFAAVECIDRLDINSVYRANLIGKLLGLKEFIETAEEPRLKSLLENDPQYFYRILPYAMVFEISDVWADHFRNIRMETPDWYHTSSMNTVFMTSSFVSTLSSASGKAITCMSPSSSSSSGGGGGFSGGGTGGGGGGAW